ncbi:RNA-directed DNA polymerase, eukaryota, reverse transcriptase zinc-binding domain protein [Tanacetum coccineum]|uniref:RNA-directed DNA polymerase, eukaryota, reverse transcriptase zinc-binding domain protein n=1 Tax=Tanacetum coccineum TaxID=301880 RepID=A0ABQ4WRT3_9ASTR
MPTRINLDHRGIDLNLVRCPICDEDVETEEHIFVHCNLARKIWKDVLLWWNAYNVNVLSLLEAINLMDKVSLPHPLSTLFGCVFQNDHFGFFGDIETSSLLLLKDQI